MAENLQDTAFVISSINIEKNKENTEKLLFWERKGLPLTFLSVAVSSLGHPDLMFRINKGKPIISKNIEL